jgi:hypothetical protein
MVVAAQLKDLDRLFLVVSPFFEAFPFGGSPVY